MSRPVLFDGSILDYGPITGVAGSFLTTLSAYVHHSPRDCVLLTPVDHRGVEIDGLRSEPCLPKGRFNRLRALRRACREHEGLLLHAPVTAIPPSATCPVIATVHDLPWLHSPVALEKGARLPARLAFRLARRRAAAIVVPSAATMRDVEQYSAVDDLKVRVIPHGVQPPDAPVDVDKLVGPFLVLGDDRPRKNLGRVRAAHAKAKAQHPDLPDLRVVDPGHGYLPEEEKWRVLRESRALLQLSLLEGFGLTVLEAFAHGVPVLCSDCSSLTEVAGGAALEADPTSEEAIAEALWRIHSDNELRADLRRRGLARAATMTPEASAAQWCALHEEILAG